MAEYGVTLTGFQRKRLDTILNDLNDAMHEIFGENLNLSPESPDGQVNGVTSESQANLWELAEACYNAFNPSAATGTELSNLVQLNGITREVATATKVNLSLVGVDGVVVPSGSIVETMDGTQLTTDMGVTFALGSAIVSATATTVGAIPVVENTVTTIVTPITGWVSVNNPAAGVTGNEYEEDADLRARRARSVARPAVGPLGSIIAEVLAVESITYAKGFENTSHTVDENGLLPHSILVVVDGGADDDIAQAIFIRKAAGIDTNGNTSGNAVDSQGVIKPLLFTRPDAIPIYARIDLTTFDSFPASGVDDIKQAIVDYANGDLVAGYGFGVAEDVIRTELFTAINTTPGQSVNLLAINANSPPNTGDLDNIPMAFSQKSEFLVANIEVNVL